jgi:hypothetical protein
MSVGGAPKGNKNAAKGKRWLESLDKALKQYTDKTKKIEAGQALDRIARMVVKEALGGAYWAIEEIGNRLDGKPSQSIDFTGEITHVRDLSDAQLLERLERARDAAGADESPPGAADTSGIH